MSGFWSNCGFFATEVSGIEFEDFGKYKEAWEKKRSFSEYL
jgi:hypothetical protein